jgi:hypothetical protein
MMVWKDIIQSIRSFRLPDAFGWLSLFAAGLGVLLIPDLGARGLSLAFWAVTAGQQGISRLQKDLGRWSLMRMLPFSSKRLLVAELLLPWSLVVLLGWIILAVAGSPSLIVSPLSAAFWLLSTSASISFASAYDLLRQAKPELLLNGSSPQASSAGSFLSVLCVAITLGLWFWLGKFNLDGTVPAIALAVLLTLYYWRLAGRRLQRLD